MFEWVIARAVPTADSLVYCLLYAWFCGRFGACRWKRRRLAALCLALLWILAEKAVLLCGQYGFVTGICLKLLGVLLRFALAWLFYRLGADKLLFVAFVFSSAWAVAEFLARQLLSMFDSVSLLLTLSKWLRMSGETFFFLNKLLLTAGILLADLLCALLVWLYCRLICTALKDKDRRFSRTELCFLLLPPVAAWLEHWALHILIYQKLPAPPQGSVGDYPAVRAISILVMVLLLAMSVLNIAAYQHLVDALRERTERAILERQNADMRRHLDEVTRLGESIRSARHDMKNHIAVLTQLAAGVEGHSELKDYLAELGERTGHLDARFSTGLAAIDALLGGKEREARERLGSDFSLRAERLIFPKLFIREYDIAVILGNALDNAIEACEKSDGEAMIELSAEKRGNMLLLEVRNSFAGTLRQSAASGFPLTSKTDAAEHGIGFPNMRTTAEKYHGAVDWRAENGQFILTVMLQNMKPEQ